MLKLTIHIVFLISLAWVFGSCGEKESDFVVPLPGDSTEVSCYNFKPVFEKSISDEDLLNIVQEYSTRYFWDFAEPNSGMARERNTSGSTVTTGGTGFGVMALIAAAERGYVPKNEVLERMIKMCNFLKKADRFHGVWPHWLNGTTGKTIAFSTKDDGGDLVETAFLVQGLLTVREYFSCEAVLEDSLRTMINRMWREVEWSWYQNKQEVLLWHWSPKFGFEMNHKITGWNEGLIVYVLAASSPSFPITRVVYEMGWANNGAFKSGRYFYDIKLPLGADFGGPLFFAHYSFLGLDPRGLKDQYADYFEQNRAHSLIQNKYAIANPYKYCNYSDSCWGLTASDDPIKGYQAHAPFNYWGSDNGTISPTAAVSSIVYTPEESMRAIRFFYTRLHTVLWGNYGFKDAFNLNKNWFASSYLAIDQGPMAAMIENYRSGLLWNTFMKAPEVQLGLQKLGFKINK